MLHLCYIGLGFSKLLILTQVLVLIFPLGITFLTEEPLVLILTFSSLTWPFVALFYHELLREK